MKSTIVTFFLAIPLILNASGPSAEELALAKARNNGAQAKECLRVVDQADIPFQMGEVGREYRRSDAFHYSCLRMAKM